jgi:hypothetical protein
MSSDVSGLNSSSSGSTVMVTVFTNVGYVGLGLVTYCVLSCTSVLDDGREFTFATLVRSITFGTVFIRACYCDWQSTLSSSVARSDYNCLIVVTILVVFVVYGESSSYSTHLILLRRFSIL